MATYIIDATLVPEVYKQLFPTTVTSLGGVGLGRVAHIQCLTQNVRYRDDGTDPTPTTGMRIHAGESIWYIGSLKSIRFIEETSGAELNIQVYR
jgi:hypothetical protein